MPIQDFPTFLTNAGPIRNIFLEQLNATGDEDAVLKMAIASPTGANIGIIDAAVRSGQTLDEHSILYAGLLVSNWRDVVEIVENAGGVFNDADLWVGGLATLPGFSPPFPNFSTLQAQLRGRWPSLREYVQEISHFPRMIPIIARAYPAGLLLQGDLLLQGERWSRNEPFFGQFVLKVCQQMLLANIRRRLGEERDKSIEDHTKAIIFLVEQGVPLRDNTLYLAIWATVKLHDVLGDSMAMLSAVCRARGRDDINKMYQDGGEQKPFTDLARLIRIDTHTDATFRRVCFLAAKTLFDHGAVILPREPLLWLYLSSLWQSRKTIENRGPMIRLLRSKSDAACLTAIRTSARDDEAFTGTAQELLVWGFI